MSEHYLKNVIEAALLAAGKPLSVEDFIALFDETRRPAKPDIEGALAALEADYTGRGVELKETAAGFRVQVRRELAEEISRLWPERPARYSRALLETLALIAYRQPITRGEIEAVRGVAVNPNIVKTLLERNWIRVVGQRDVPGRPELLGTTREFLDYFGLKSLEELPPLAELKAMADFNVQLEIAETGEIGERGAAETVPAERGTAGADGADDAAAAAGDRGAAGAGGAAGDGGDAAAASLADAAESGSADEPEPRAQTGAERDASGDRTDSQELAAASPGPR